jgi:hypothetical protein
VPVAPLDEPNAVDVHLSLYEYLPRIDAWAHGLALCGISTRQGALPAGTAVTCEDCLQQRQNLAQTVARRAIARLRRITDAWEQQPLEAIRTVSVVEAVRTVLDKAEAQLNVLTGGGS